MPTYEYACSSCDTTHDIVQKMTDPTLTECPACGEPTLRKLFNGVGVAKRRWYAILLCASPLAKWARTWSAFAPVSSR